LVGLLACAVLMSGLLTACGTSTVAASRRAAMAPHEAVTLKRLTSWPDRSPPLTTPSATWFGPLGPQNPNPLVPGDHLLTSSTHPLVQVFTHNQFVRAETLTFDLVLTDGQPPPGYAGTSPSPGAENPKGPYPGWTDVVWERNQAEAHARDTVTVPSGYQATVRLDWPDDTQSGRHAAAGHYWAVVEVSGYWLSGSVIQGGSISTAGPSGVLTDGPTRGRTDLWASVNLR